MKINPTLYGVIVTVVFFGIIGGFQAAGFWSTSGKTNASGQAIQPAADDVNSIKGWMTLDQITSSYAVPLDELLAAFNLPADTDPQTAIKDLESDTFSVTELRTWLLNRSSIPATAAPTATPKADLHSSQVPSVTEPVHTQQAMTLTGKTTYQELLDWGLGREQIETVVGGPITNTGLVVKDDVAARGLAFSDVKSALQSALDQSQTR
jgi:hypothetical protein